MISIFTEENNFNKFNDTKYENRMVYINNGWYPGSSLCAVKYIDEAQKTENWRAVFNLIELTKF
jgi:hypothetical protein